MSKLLIKKKTSVAEIAQQLGMKATTEKAKYVFIPFWFKEHGPYEMEVVPFDLLPQEIKDEIKKQKDNANNGQQDNSETIS